MQIQTGNIVLDEDYSNVLEKQFVMEYGQLDKLKNPYDVVQVMNEVFNLSKQAEEHFYLIALNSGNIPICFFEVSKGTCFQAPVGFREIFVRVLLCGAVNLIFAHNHPGGNRNPSEEDLNITLKLKRCAAFLGLQLIDHVIVTQKGFYSMKKDLDNL